MSPEELRVLFKAVQDTSVKKVIDNIKGEVNSLGATLDKVNKKMGGDVLGGLGGSSSFKKLNPQLFQKAGNQAAQSFIKGLKEPAYGRELGKIFSMGDISKQGLYKGTKPPILSGMVDKVNKDRAAFMKDMTFAMNPLLNPTSLWGHLFASRQIFSAFSTTKTGQGIMGKFGLGGTSGAALMSGALIGALTTVGLSLKALQKTIQEASKTYAEAARMYSKALNTGGLSIGFVQRRTMLSNILGVSDTEVWKFSTALAYLNPRLEWSAGILSKNTRNLTSVNWEWKILEYNLQAMFSDLANDAAPALRKFSDGMSAIVKVADELYNRYKVGLSGAIAALLPPSLLAAFKGVSSLGTDSGAAPAPMAFMKQLRASSFEHMGLVMGGGQRDESIELQRKTVEKLSRILTAIQGDTKKTPSWYMNRNPYVSGH